jgi:DNA-binding NarL/FixJ family response regulator
MIRVLIVDDHPVVVQGVREILARTADVVVGGAAPDADAALQALVGETWDLVILDLSLPRTSGLELLAAVKCQYPRMPVLILSMHSEAHMVTQALRAGAAGYLTKDSAPDELVVAVRRIAGGGRYVTASVAEALVGEIQQPGDGPQVADLSSREREVLLLIASGLSLRRIAERLRLAETTVGTYRTRILRKMGLASNAELVRYAVEHHLI